MTRKEVEERFAAIADKDTDLSGIERIALQDMYEMMWDQADLGLTESARETSLKIAGAIELLTYLRKIKDDEDLHMMMNEIESLAYKVANGDVESSWSAAGKRVS